MTDPKWTNPSAFVDVCEALVGMLEAMEWVAKRGDLGPGQHARMYAAQAALSRARNEKETG